MSNKYCFAINIAMNIAVNNRTLIILYNMYDLLYSNKMLRCSQCYRRDINAVINLRDFINSFTSTCLMRMWAAAVAVKSGCI